MQATSTPRVSILLPAYDAERTLPATLRSILRQTEPRWECVIVDDGSSDASLACARTFAERDARFVVVSVPHGGLVAALNAGIEHCRADVVARMDADDLMHRRRLAAQLQLLDAEPQLVAVGNPRTRERSWRRRRSGSRPSGGPRPTSSAR